MAQLPEKLYYKIGEVTSLTNVKPYVLRYWESEFKIVKPRKSRSKQRVYSKRDIGLILEIKRLLHKEKYTLEGVKKRIKQIQVEEDKQLRLDFPADKYGKTIISITKELKSIKKMLAE